MRSLRVTLVQYLKKIIGVALAWNAFKRTRKFPEINVAIFKFQNIYVIRLTFIIISLFKITV